MYAACMRPYSLPRKVSTFALLLRFLGVSQRIPKSGCEEHLILNPYSVNNVTVLRLHPASKSANLTRPRARTHTRVLPP